MEDYAIIYDEIQAIKLAFDVDSTTAATMLIASRLDTLATGIAAFGKGGIGGLLGGFFSPKAVDG